MTSNVITDLRINKSIDDDTPKLGEEVTWTIQVANDSSGNAENVVVSDLLPEGMSYVSSQVSTGSIDVANGVWSLGGVGAGSDATATITMVVTDGNYHITNNATVSSDTHDCNPSNDTNSVTVVPWIPTRADLSLVKTVSDPEPEVGSTVEWKVIVSNSGPDTAWDTVVKDTLPEGVTFVGARATSGSYDFATGEWDVGDLANGASAEIVISTSIDTGAAAEYVNTAVATSLTYDNNETNNTGEATIVVTDNAGGEEGGHEGHECYVSCCCACDHQEVTGADLQIVKLVDNPTPNLNGEVVWSLLVVNNGPEDAVNVVVNDNLPAGVEYVSDTGMGQFDPAAGAWEIGDLANGASALLQITTIATDAAVAQVNIAMVSSDTEDSNPANDVAHASIDAVNADLSIVKTVDNEAPDLGSEVVWTIDVINNGPDAAENVIIDDVLPDDTTFVRVSDDLFDDVAGTIAIGTLAPGEEFSFDVTVTVDSADGPRTNLASVTSTTYDDDQTNNSDTAVVDAVAADLELVKGVLPETAAPGDSVEWTITVSNQGPDEATGIQVQDVLPVGVQYESDSAGGSVPLVSFLGDSWMAADFLPGAVVEPILESIRVAQGDVTYTNLSISGHTAEEMLIETVWQEEYAVTNPDTVFLDFGVNEFNEGIAPESYGASLANLFDAIAAVSPASEIVFLIPAETAPDLPAYQWSEYVDAALVATEAAGVQVINLGDSIAPYESGSALWYDSLHISVDAAADVFDAVSDGYVFPDGDFNAASGVWSVGDLAAGDSVSLVIQALVTDTGALTNVAEIIASDQVDPDSTVDNDDGDQSEDDEDNALLTVPEIIDLELTQTISNTTPDIGEDVTFTITVTNTSTVPATGVSVLSQLPDYFTSGDLIFTGSSDSGVAADPTSDWLVGDLAPGETVTLTVEATANTAGEIINVAEVATADQDDVDSIPANDVEAEDDQQSVSLTVPEIIDLELTQEISSETPDVGDTVTYTITVTNASAIPATGVIVATQLPAHFEAGVLSLVDSSDAGFAAAPESGWIIGDVGPGETVVLTVDAAVEAPGTIVNIAQVSAADQDDVDSTPANDDATEDDQESVTFTAVDPNPVPTAVNETFAITSNPEALNAVIMVDHSGSMGSLNGPDQSGSPYAGLDTDGDGRGDADIIGLDGLPTSRLELVREAVVDFAGKEQVGAIKILGFDGNAGGAGNVSTWYDVSGSQPVTSGVQAFVDGFVASGFTNYGDALKASQDYFEADVNDAPDPLPSTAPVNYYFLTDGNPLSGDGSNPLPNGAEQTAWESFVDANYNEAYGIGFGAGVTDFASIDLVSHPDDADEVGAQTAEENTIFASMADQIPAELYRTIAESVTGNVTENDIPGDDGPAISASAVSSLAVGDTVYVYDGTSVAVSGGSAPATTVLRSDNINTPVSSGGRLEFNFADGSFEYFAPFTEVAFTEMFEYSIADGSGDIDTGTLTIDVAPGTPMQPALAEPADSLVVDNDELFSAESIATVQVSAEESNDLEWSGGSSLYGSELYDTMSLVI